MTRFRAFLILAAVLAAPAARAAVVAAPGYHAYTITTPGTVQGGLVRRGGAVLVGQGAFGVGGEQVIRLDGGGATTIATGFNSLGGFDIDAGGTLYVVDNGGDQAGAVTGDTLFAIADAVTRTTAVGALGHEVVPAGTIPFAMHPLVLSTGDVLVSDAAGFGSGRIVRVAAGAPPTASTFISGLDFLGALALDLDGSLLVDNVVFDPVTFASTGAVLRFAIADGHALGTLKDGLSGALGLVLDGDGNALVSGGFTPDFSSSTVIAIAPGGAVTERAHGFSFSGEMFFDAARDELLVLDFGVQHIDAICRDVDADGVCDADDDCPTVADPAQTDTDGDGLGDACDPCTGVTVQKPMLAVRKLGAPAGDESLGFSGRLTLPFPITPALDPVTKGLRLLVSDTVGTLLDATLPGGAFDPATETGWQIGKGGAFKYRNKQGGILGIASAAVKPSTKVPGLVKVAVRGKKALYPVDPTRLPLSATVVLDAAAGQCGDAVFPGPAPTPACTHDPVKAKVTCR